MYLQNLFRQIHRRIYALAAVRMSGIQTYTFYVNDVINFTMKKENFKMGESEKNTGELEVDHARQLFKGPKEKEDKPDWSIFPFDEAEHVLRVFEYGAKKYCKPFTYRQLVPPDELLAAAIRHLICIQNGFSCDRESGLLHWAHIAANALMALSHYRKVKI